MTLIEWAATWIDSLELTRRRGTVRVYRSYLRSHILRSPLATKPLEAIDDADVRALAIAVVRKGVAPTTARECIYVLTVCLDAAIHHGLLRTNPARGATRGLVPRRRLIAERPVPRTDDSARFLATVEAHEPELFPFYLVLVRTGVRLGEALALQWEAVDPVRRTITVRYSWRDGRLGPTKSGRSREVDLASDVAALLMELPRSSRWLFPSSRTGQPWGHTYMLNVTARLCSVAGLQRLTPHRWRHGWATELYRLGADITYVQHNAGHADERTTRGYIHAQRSHDPAQMDRLIAHRRHTSIGFHHQRESGRERRRLV